MSICLQIDPVYVRYILCIQCNVDFHSQAIKFIYLVSYQQVRVGWGRPKSWLGVIVLDLHVTTLPIHHNNPGGMCQRVDINNPGSFYNYVKSN